MKSYNSLSGHLSTIGNISRKVLDWQVCTKRSRYCALGKRIGRKLKNTCHKNWTGSAQAIEPHMAIQSLHKLKSKGLLVKHIIGDADTTTEVRAKKAFSHEIVKSLDKNHILKNLGNSLYAVKKQHKVLSVVAIRYLQKCVQYALATSKTKQELKVNLTAIVPHAFGYHSSCTQTRWCRAVQNPSVAHIYKSLPGGKPLVDVNLNASLVKVLEQFTSPSMIDKLLHSGSTQANENFNHIVSRKAPKAVHYSASSSLHYRVAAAVTQKNEGHAGINQVFSLNLLRYCIKIINYNKNCLPVSSDNNV